METVVHAPENPPGCGSWNGKAKVRSLRRGSAEECRIDVRKWSRCLQADVLADEQVRRLLPSRRVTARFIPVLIGD